MATAGELITRIQRLFGDESATFLETADMYMWLNDAQLDIARHTDILAGELSGTTVAGTNNISGPTDLIRLTQVVLNQVPLQEYPIENDRYTTSLSVEVPTGGFTYWKKLIYFASGSTVSAVSYKILYSRRPATLTVTGDIPEIP